jgi:hypothetical protein
MCPGSSCSRPGSSCSRPGSSTSGRPGSSTSGRPGSSTLARPGGKAIPVPPPCNGKRLEARDVRSSRVVYVRSSRLVGVVSRLVGEGPVRRPREGGRRAELSTTTRKQPLESNKFLFPPGLYFRL